MASSCMQRVQASIVRHPDLLKGLFSMGFDKPSKIQEKALPLLLTDPSVTQGSTLYALLIVARFV